MKSLTHIIAIVWLCAVAPALGFIINPFRFTVAGGGGDPYFSSVKLLLHLDGSNGATSATDSSASARAMTFYGNAQLTTTSPKYGSAALLLDGTGDYIDTPSSADFEFAGDFTLEAWVYLTTSSGSYKTIFGSGTYGLYHYSNTLTWYSTAAGLNTFGTITNDAWHHIAISRSGTSLKCFIDGVQSGSTLTSSTSFTCTTTWKIGYDTIGSAYLTSKIDDIRVTKGVARYTADFTAPTGALPDS
jgi:hypothetical protein